MQMPILETERLVIRPFAITDLERVYQILDLELGNVDFGFENAKGLLEREKWLHWTIMNCDELARLYRPPYGNRAVCLKQTEQLIGVVGYVPCLEFSITNSERVKDNAKR